MTRLWIAVLAAAAGGCQVYEGVWLPLQVERVVSAGGFAYGSGVFEPERLVRGDAALLVVDVEKMLATPELVIPEKDLARSPFREANLGKSGMYAVSASRLLGFQHGNDPVVPGTVGPYTVDQLTSAHVAAWELGDRYQPRLASEADVENGRGYAAFAVLPVSDTLALLQLFTIVDGAQPAWRLVAVTLPSLVQTDLPLTLEACGPLTFDAGRQLLHCILNGAGPGDPALLRSYHVTLDAPAVELVGQGPIPEVTYPSGLTVLPDGSVLVSNNAPSATGMATLVSYTAGSGPPVHRGTWQVDTGWTLYVPRATAGNRVLAHVSNQAVLLELPGSGGSATTLARLELPGFAGEFVPYASPATPAAELYLVPMGRQGLMLIEVQGDMLRQRGGFFHTWQDQLPFLTRTGLYPER